MGMGTVLAQTPSSAADVPAQRALLDLRLGTGLEGFRYVPELRRRGVSVNGSATFRVAGPLRLGIYVDHQQTSGEFTFYRITDRGSLQPESYGLSATATQAGVMARVVLDQKLAQYWGFAWPSFLSIYQSYFLGVTYLDGEVSEQVKINDAFTGLDTSRGVAFFPGFGEDVKLSPGLMLGVDLYWPRFPARVYAEAGLGPLSFLNVGIGCQLF